MTDEEIADLLPGVSYARAITDGIAKRCHPQRNTPHEISLARAEANNLARFIDWSVLPLLKDPEAWQEMKAYHRVQARLFRFGKSDELHGDFSDQIEPHQVLLANFDEFARRMEEAAERMERAAEGRGCGRQLPEQAKPHRAWFSRGGRREEVAR